MASPFDELRNGDLSAVRIALDANPALLEAQDEETGQTPFVFAAGQGDVAAVKMLLSLGANPDALDYVRAAVVPGAGARRGACV
jgi:ankyrin repeat protein